MASTFELTEQRHGPPHLARLDPLLEGREPRLGERVGTGRTDDVDAIVIRRCDLLVVRDELLAQLLARTEAREDDFDVLVRFEARELDHVTREVEDPDRLPHLEDERLAAGSEGGRLEDELRGL